MSPTTTTKPVDQPTPPALDHVDVLIVGAGLSGIGAAVHLTNDCPGKTYAILEARDAIGGTWDLFRYPGVRSDSDMFTLGYNFKPWRQAKSIADGPSILEYIRETAAERQIDKKIRFHHRIVRADWSSADARWTVTAERTDTGQTVTVTCDFLYMCTGYYRYDQGYTPDFPGTERFQGRIVHPQHWPADLDYAGKKVVVIGSGATAVTLIPSMADTAEHVTMLQRSPSYVFSLPNKDPLADLLRKRLPAKAAYTAVRWKNAGLATLMYKLSRAKPDFMRKALQEGARKQLPAGYDIDPNFTPRYQPWDQRLCLVPDGDLFKAIRSGKASVLTDGIETFTERGLKLTSGKELEADVIITATGLNLLVLGGMKIGIDGREIELSQTVTYKGMMFDGVPNLALALGYTNASWTLKVDLVSAYICRLINFMDAQGYQAATPHHPDPARDVEPFLDLASGYVLRSLDQLPKQGHHAPWRLHQNYPRDLLMFRYGNLENDMDFTARRPAAAAPPAPVGQLTA